MISLIIFFIGVIATYTFSYLFLSDVLSYVQLSLVVPVSIIGMIAINGIVAIICSKLIPNKWFDKDSKFYMPSAKQCKFYEKLGVKKWKDKTLEMGFLNGFRKNKIENEAEHIERFILENKKGYLTHFVSVIASALAIFILPIKFWLPLELPIIITSIILNIIPMIILKYNMPRLKTLLRFNQRKKNNMQQENKADNQEREN